MGGEMDAVMKQKVENDAAAYLRSICAKRGRNSALAETAVRESKSFTEQEALDQHLIDLIAPDERDLLRQLDGRDGHALRRPQRRRCTPRGAAIEVYQRTLRQRIISAIADPNIALVLLVLGALGIYVEFTSPGLIVPGVMGAILVLLGLSALSVLPINWLGAALLLLAFALFVLEAKFATHGILGVGRRGGHGAGRGDADRQSAARNAHPLATAIAWRCRSRSSPCCCSRWRCARARNKVVTGAGRHDRRDRRRCHGAGAGGQGVRARRILERGLARRRCAAGARVRVTAIDKLQTDGGTGSHQTEAEMIDLRVSPRSSSSSWCCT